MAQLLIKAVDATHPGPSVDRQGCYKRGDIVVVVDDSHVFSPAEDLPTFIRVSLPGVSVAAAEALRDSEIISPAEYAPAAVQANRALYDRYKKAMPPETVTRRRYAVPEAVLQPGAALSLSQIKDKKHAT